MMDSAGAKLSEMVERVARVFDRYAFEDSTPTIDDPGTQAYVVPQTPVERNQRQAFARIMARKVIKAMREPTEGMTRAVHICAEAEYNGAPKAGDVWQAMIDAALK